MHIKVDEDLPPIVAQRLENEGYSANTVVQQGMGGWKDHALWQVVRADKHFLLTADKGFADIRHYPPGTHAGILLLRPKEDGIRPLLSLLEAVLARIDLRQLQQTVSVASPQGLRIRHIRK